ncbi:hypothetical protein niasHT_024278 [Heterodera trifolii]|uniref:Uncharacterized protein n=1 Tax=Heterodera trifolii TaxID=157864 RepID=A0ABD2JM65_9BILA
MFWFSQNLGLGDKTEWKIRLCGSETKIERWEHRHCREKRSATQSGKEPTDFWIKGHRRAFFWLNPLGRKSGKDDAQQKQQQYLLGPPQGHQSHNSFT